MKKATRNDGRDDGDRNKEEGRQDEDNNVAGNSGRVRISSGGGNSRGLGSFVKVLY